MTGPQTTVLDFIFLPELLEGAAQGDVKRSFEAFIVALLTLVGSKEGQASCKEQFVRRIDYHKLEEVKEMDECTYFFRHCFKTRLCVKLLRGGGDKVLMYGYRQ